MYSDIGDEKYLTFKGGDFARLINKIGALIENGWAYDGGDMNKWVDDIVLEDAVVIRRQDVFSPPAFDAYANSIMVTIEALKAGGIEPNGRISGQIDRLNDIAAYFHAQADMAWDTDRKIPD